MHRREVAKLIALATLIVSTTFSTPILAQSSGPASRLQPMPMHDSTPHGTGHRTDANAGGKRNDSNPGESRSAAAETASRGKAGGGQMRMQSGGGSGSMGGMIMGSDVAGMPASGPISLPASMTGLALEDWNPQRCKPTRHSSRRRLRSKPR